jgi:RNA polymerase primary sigma factor
MTTSALRRNEKPQEHSSLLQYLEEIQRYPLLTREEETALARRIRENDADALNRLVCANLRFVVSVAKKYQNQGVSLADLINEGNIGLIQAAERFDESKGVKFISYAIWWIRQAILLAIAENGHTVRIPINRASVRYHVGKHASRLRQELGREPTRTELGARLHISDKELSLTLPLTQPYVSLDEPLASGDNNTLLDCLVSVESTAPGDRLSADELPRLLGEALDQLPGREGPVLRLCFGLEDNAPQTLDQIAGRLGVTRERIRQIRDRGLSRLRKSRNVRLLAALSERE